MSRTSIAAAAIFAMTFTACAGASAPTAPASSGPATPVRFMVANPVINLGHVQLGVAVQEGYYKDANVNVSYLTSPGTVAVVQAVASGTADMGQADTLSIDSAVAQNVKNVKAVCSYVANNIYYVVVRDDSPVKSPADLKGKKIGLSSLATGVYYNAKVMLKDAGIDPTGVTFVTIAQPAAQLNALSNGTVDALSIIDVSVGTFENQGVKLRLFQPKGPLQWQWNVVVTSDAFLKDHADAVAGVCRALQQSELFVATNPSKGLDLFKKWGGDLGGVPDAQAVNVIKSRSVPGFRTYTEGNDQWGWMNVDAMNDLGALYFSLGLLKTNVAVKDAYTNEFLPKMKFDEAKVKSQAQ